MTTSEPTPSNPVFQTPNPADLQDEESQASTQKRLIEQQGTETDVVDDHDSTESSTDSASIFGGEGDLSLRQSQHISRSGG